MIISIFGTNGMLSKYLTYYFINQNSSNIVNVLGLEEPNDYKYSNFTKINLINDEIDYNIIIDSDVIIYAAGAGVQAALKTDSKLMYELNLYIPVNICNELKERNYNGIYISFGSYMEIGINNDENAVFDELHVELSRLPVTNDYALSKRLYTRFMGCFQSPYRFWHFILPNIYVKNETGTRLIPYVLNYLKKMKKGEKSKPPKFSSGDQIRQYINFEDTCYSIVKCIEANVESGVYNIGGGEIFSIKELIIRLFSFYQIPIHNEMFGHEKRRDNEIKSLKINGDKLKKEIGYSPSQRIESIL